ncbi:MAG: uncharacterized membrane protein (UPF0127 family) [Arenicella sp.]|jgi:uncharacterized membrane protein (UPF0127 family)
MKITIVSVARVFLILLISAPSYAQQDCQIDNPALQAMPLIKVTLTREDGSTHSMPAKLADNNTTRAAGFQRVCGSTIEAMPILFAFKRQAVPSFHMNNVVAPIDIAFIDKDGDFESIQAMNPYSVIVVKKKLYSPKRPILYALEVHRGFYQNHDISVASKMTWAPSAGK